MINCVRDNCEGLKEAGDEDGFSRAEAGRGMVVVRDEERTFRLRGASNHSTNCNRVSRETPSQEPDNLLLPAASLPSIRCRVRDYDPGGMLM